MRTRLLLVPMLLTVACDADDETVYRAAPTGGSDFSIHQGTDASEPDIIWDIVGGDVYDGAASDGIVIANVSAGGITTTEGGSCTFDASGPMLRLRDADGVAVFTVWQKWVLAGDFVIPPTTGGVPAHLGYTFQTRHIHAGVPANHSILATATVNVQFAPDATKLLIAALLEDTCGSRDGT